MAYYDPNQLQSFGVGQTPEDVTDFSQLNSLADFYNPSTYMGYSPYSGGFRGEGTTPDWASIANQQATDKGFDSTGTYARGNTVVGPGAAHTLYQQQGNQWQPVQANWEPSGGASFGDFLKTAAILGGAVASGGAALGGLAGVGGGLAGSGLTASGAGAATGGGIGYTAGTGLGLAGTAGTGAAGITASGAGAAGFGAGGTGLAGYGLGDYAKQAYKGYNTLRGAEGTYNAAKEGNALGVIKGALGTAGGLNSMYNYSVPTSAPLGQSLQQGSYEMPQSFGDYTPTDYSLGNTNYSGGADYTGGIQPSNYSFGETSAGGNQYDLGNFTSGLSDYGQLNFSGGAQNSFMQNATPAGMEGAGTSPWDEFSKLYKKASPYLGAAQTLGGAISGQIQGHQAAKAAANQARMLQGQQRQLADMYGPNSPYAQQLHQQLARKDAAAGRNSQYGPREVQLQAALADMNSRNAPMMAHLGQQELAAREGVNKVRNQQINNLLTQAPNLVNVGQTLYGGAQPGIKYLSDLFGG